METTLKLADRFDAPIIRRDCEEYLITDEEAKLHQKIIWGDRHNLPFLLDECIKKTPSARFIRELMESDESRHLSQSFKDILFLKMLKPAPV
ncbi:hypothetical protein PFISCL1PPCAC_21047 [Pristionchus fissidentatus]|uniref:Uncharacterized protein n=1 Tax=Pristionchus fissidentatus TaxID=1538716 RepID=A0AAV5WDK2_9BILA|nr:hypothetical protein PFISCL1PPCAC_21047 [Pristionchus fissidentatus]